MIGTGAIGGMHALAIGDLPNAELVAGCDKFEEGVKNFSGKFGCAAYTDVAEMIQHANVDVVTIATPSGAHLEPAQTAFTNGAHVLCEKPLEIKLERVDAMIASAKEHGLTLGGIFPQRFNPVLQAVRGAAADGRFGRLAVVNSYVPWWRDDAYYAPGRWQGTLALDGGGALMNQSIHGVDAIQWIAGAAMDLEAGENPVEEAFAYTGKLAHAEDLIEVEDTCVVTLKFRNGTLGQMLATTSLYPGTFKRFQVGGRDGTAEILEDQMTTWRFRDETDADEEIRNTYGKETEHGGGAADPMAIDYGLHTANIGAFLDALEKGVQPEIDGAEARKAVAIIEAVYQSAASGQAVKVG
ncbi:MAG: Gfo/Idh/MocA family protein [Planctomycetota bacterium]